MKVLDLFSGIGGFSLGLERAGMETVAFCENEPFCQKVLAKHWPEVPIHNDIRELDGEQYNGKIDIITGGYPCQPFSVAGKREGHKDDRHLWPEMLRIIKQARPTWVIAENVAGHVTMGLDQVLSDLEIEGYSTTTLNIPACAVDADHKRARIWIIAYANSDKLREQSRGRNGQNGKGEALAFIDGKTQPMANTEGQQSTPSDNRREQGSPSKQREGESRGSDRGRVRGINWPIEPGVGRVADGVPRRMDRLRSIGNAVVPQIPEVIGRAILEYENKKANLL